MIFIAPSNDRLRSTLESEDRKTDEVKRIVNSKIYVQSPVRFTNTGKLVAGRLFTPFIGTDKGQIIGCAHTGVIYAKITNVF